MRVSTLPALLAFLLLGSVPAHAGLYLYTFTFGGIGPISIPDWEAINGKVFPADSFSFAVDGLATTLGLVGNVPTGESVNGFSPREAWITGINWDGRFSFETDVDETVPWEEVRYLNFYVYNPTAVGVYTTAFAGRGVGKGEAGGAKVLYTTGTLTITEIPEAVPESHSSLVFPIALGFVDLAAWRWRT